MGGSSASCRRQEPCRSDDDGSLPVGKSLRITAVLRPSSTRLVPPALRPTNVQLSDVRTRAACQPLKMTATRAQSGHWTRCRYGVLHPVSAVCWALNMRQTLTRWSSRLSILCEPVVGQISYSLARGFCIRRIPAARICPTSVSRSSAVMVLGSGCPAAHRTFGCSAG